LREANKHSHNGVGTTAGAGTTPGVGTAAGAGTDIGGAGTTPGAGTTVGVGTDIGCTKAVPPHFFYFLNLRANIGSDDTIYKNQICFAAS
jgi:hypothetical protein